MRYVLVSYSTEHLAKKDKVRFFYALNGRNSEGVLKQTGTERLGRSVLSVPEPRASELRQFLGYWKCIWKEVPVTFA